MRFSYRDVVCLLAAFVLASWIAPRASAQATSGTISGSVSDQSGALIPAASAAVRNLDTNVSRSALTDSEGRFRFPGLPVGRYELSVEARGFAKHMRGPIQLVLNQEAVIAVEMQAATVQETIVVSEDAPVIDTT